MTFDFGVTLTAHNNLSLRECKSSQREREVFPRQLDYFRHLVERRTARQERVSPLQDWTLTHAVKSAAAVAALVASVFRVAPQTAPL